MPRFPSKIVDRFEVAQGTMAFAFERPPAFNFTAGQFMTVTLPNALYEDEKGNRRSFSIASPPHELDRLTIATRMTGSAMKRSLAEMPPGTPVSLFGPSGSFVLPADADAPSVFIAGGIGITPFRSMLLDAGERRLPHEVLLIYSNRNPEGAAFLDEMMALTQGAPGLRCVPTMTNAEGGQPPWTGERRVVCPELLHDLVADMALPVFYVAGPPGLVAAVARSVVDAGADPARVRSEEFEGY